MPLCRTCGNPGSFDLPVYTVRVNVPLCLNCRTRLGDDINRFYMRTAHSRTVEDHKSVVVKLSGDALIAVLTFHTSNLFAVIETAAFSDTTTVDAHSGQHSLGVYTRITPSFLQDLLVPNADLTDDETVLVDYD
jgi:hypothetical protein